MRLRRTKPPVIEFVVDPCPYCDAIVWRIWEHAQWDEQRRKRRYQAMPWSMRLVKKLGLIGPFGASFSFTYTKTYPPFGTGKDYLRK